MRITLVTVGKIKEKFFVQAIEEYSKRLSRYCKLEIIEVADEKTPDKASEALELQIKEKEGETEVIAYVSDNAAGHEMLMAIRNTVAEMKQLDDENEFGRLEIHIDNMKEEDWANNWKKYFHLSLIHI